VKCDSCVTPRSIYSHSQRNHTEDRKQNLSALQLDGREKPQRGLHETLSKDHLFWDGTIRIDSDGAAGVSANAAYNFATTGADAANAAAAQTPQG
jgi:hypothetical protein